jgi:hypothetical protein
VGGVRRRSWIPGLAGLLALSACFVDPGVSVGDNTGATTTDGTSGTGGADTTSRTTGSIDPTTSSDATTSVTTTTTGPTTVDPTTSTPETTDGTCGVQGTACDELNPTCCGCLACLKGICELNNGGCLECHTCGPDGACTQVVEGTACTINPDPCTGTLWGEQSGVCYANGPATAKCTADAKCTLGGCEQQGPPIYSCPECVRAMNPCKQGAPPADVTFDNFCHTSGIAPACHPVCVDDGQSASTNLLACTAMGTCESTGIVNCGGYNCNANSDQCLYACAPNEGCQETYYCQDGVCYPF